MSLIEFPYTSYKGYLMPIIPVTISDHIFWVYVDSGAVYSVINAKEAEDILLKEMNLPEIKIKTPNIGNDS